MNLRILMLTVVVLAATRSAFAADEPDKVIREPDKVVYKKQTDLDFSDVMVNGELIKPNGAYVKDRHRIHFDALIEQRGNFRPELMDTMATL